MNMISFTISHSFIIKMNPGEIKFTFGKYEGNSVMQVYSIDKGYLYWCIKTPDVIRKHHRLTSAIREYIKECKNTESKMSQKLELKIITYGSIHENCI